ncbi:probable RNA-directed DNA polymerase from transposon X-element [Trichonephila clavipes]|nr:probable RNA-directed DNA polymerase from transposon X-element [Trichonephila clavipes]
MPRDDEQEDRAAHAAISHHTLPRNNINKDIFNMTELCYLKIKVEPLFDPSSVLRSAFAAKDFITHQKRARKRRELQDAAKAQTDFARLLTGPANSTSISTPPPVSVAPPRCPTPPQMSVASASDLTTPPVSTTASSRPRPAPTPSTCQASTSDSNINSNTLSQPSSITKTLKQLHEDPDVVALQEAFLRPSSDLNIANYATYRIDRLTHRGGGTAILVKNSIPHHSIQITTSTVELTSIVIESQPSNITICSLYNPPGSSARNLIPDLQKIFRNRSQCIIVGDYNAKHASWSATSYNNPAGNAVARLIRTKGFLLTAPNDPTRIPSAGRPATLDFSLSCGINNVTAEVHSDLSSDHNPVHFVISIDSSIPFKQNCKTFTNWNKFQNIIANSLPGNPQISNREEIEEAIDANIDVDSLHKLVADNNNRNNTLYPPLLGFRGLVYGTKEKADCFADNLEESFTENRTPYDDDHIDKVDRAIRSFLNNYSTSIPPLTSPHEVCGIISQLNIHKAPGHDQIKNIALKSLPMNAITHLTKIFNKFLLLQYFPQIWKHCTVTLLSKKSKDPKFPLNYRPISLISCVAKLFEKILLSRIQAFSDSNHLIPDFQHGFRKKTSTCHQLLRTTNMIIDGFNNHRTTGGIFLDVEKAFDRVWHNGLIFNLYTYDFPTSPTVEVCLFADDAAILSQSRSPELVRKNLQAYLVKLKKWLTLWRISINTSKSQAIIFKKGKYKNKLNPIKLSRNPITWCDEVQYLGVTLDKKLTYRSHILQTANKFRIKLHALYRLLSKKSKLNLDKKRLIYLQHQLPVLLYACQIWGNTANYLLDKLQVLQNQAIRTILNAPKYIPRIILHRELKITSIR